MRLLHLPQFDEQLANITLETDLKRRSDFLNALNVGLIVLHLIALAISILPPGADAFSIATVSSSLALNIVVFYLNRRGFIRPAMHLFCHGFNIIILLTFLYNLLVEPSPTLAISIGYLLALSVLLAGMLISPRATFGFATLNTALVIIPYILASASLAVALTSAFPIVAFLYLIAIISWLYQRTLKQALDRLGEARQRVLQNELMRRDLAIARDLQKSLYPHPPLIGGEVEIASRSEPARETSGDFYDFIELGPDSLGLVIADVTGKSLAAALVMAMTRSTLRGEARRTASPAEVLQQANQILCSDTSVKHLITAFYGILNTRTLMLQCANAGHLFPTLKRDGRVEDIELCGLPLGARPGIRYDEQAIQLRPGDQLILISDGIVEAMNADHELFGFDRLAETIRQTNGATSQQALQAIWQAVERFRGDIEQQDDITLITIKIGDGAAADRSARPQLPG